MMPSLQLSSSERKHLRGLAHSLKPLITVGRRGLSESAIKEMDFALDCHELIKIRLGEGRELKKAEKKELLQQLAQQLHCGVAGVVGHVGVLYRPARDPEMRRIGV